MKKPRNVRTVSPIWSIACDTVSTSKRAPSDLQLRLHVARGRGRIGLDVDAIERAGGLEDFLRGAEVECRERDRSEVVAVTEAEDADDLELLRRPAQEDPHVVADREPIVACGRGIHRDFVAAAAHDSRRRRRDGGPAIGPRRADGRRPATADALAVAARRTARTR